MAMAVKYIFLGVGIGLGILFLRYFVQIVNNSLSLPDALQALIGQNHTSSRGSITKQILVEGYEIIWNQEYSEQEISKNVVCILIEDVSIKGARQVLSFVAMIDKMIQDNFESSVIFFHQRYPLKSIISNIRGSTARNVYFVNIDSYFQRLPREGAEIYDLYNHDPNWSRRDKWSYHNMIRFWFRDIFQLLPAGVENFLRLDTDSKITKISGNLFEHMQGRKYMANDVMVEWGPVAEGFEIFVKEFVSENFIKPRNSALWNDAFSNAESKLFYNNFEIGSVPFFRSAAVLNFTVAVMRSNGIYRYRWGDALLRYATIAIFASSSDLIQRSQVGIEYCHPC